MLVLGACRRPRYAHVVTCNRPVRPGWTKDAPCVPIELAFRQAEPWHAFRQLHARGAFRCIVHLAERPPKPAVVAQSVRGCRRLLFFKLAWVALHQRLAARVALTGPGHFRVKMRPAHGVRPAGAVSCRGRHRHLHRTIIAIRHRLAHPVGVAAARHCFVSVELLQAARLAAACALAVGERARSLQLVLFRCQLCRARNHGNALSRCEARRRNKLVFKLGRAADRHWLTLGLAQHILVLGRAVAPAAPAISLLGQRPGLDLAEQAGCGG